MGDVTLRLDTLGRPAASEADAAVRPSLDPSLSRRRAAWVGRCPKSELFLLAHFRAGCNSSRGRHMEITDLDPIRSEHGPVGVTFVVGHQDRAASGITGHNLLAAGG